MSEQQAYQARADELHEQGGVPPRRALVVALREQGMTYQAIADELGLPSRGNAHGHVDAYGEQREQAQWLLDHGPDGDALGTGD